MTPPSRSAVRPSLPLAERQDPGDHAGEVELPLERPLGEPRKVLGRQVIASVRDEDARALRKEPWQIDHRRLARRRETDQHERAAGREQRETLGEGCPATDDVEHEVDRPRFGVRRAELQRLLGLLRVLIERSDLRRPGKPGSLHDREADRAAADHRDSVALADPGNLEHRHHARRDGAADQARLLDGQRRRHLHGGGFRDDGVRRERPGTQHGSQRLPVAAQQAARRRRRLPADARVPGQAGGAGPAGSLPAEDDAVAGRERRDSRAGRLDRAGALVPEQHRIWVTPAVLFDHVQVAVADARRLDADEHLAGLGRGDVDLLERDHAALAEDYTRVSHERSSSATECAPRSARLRSSSAIRFWSSSSTARCPPTASA